ncbi:MBL fold metallo-hydrolase [Asaia astilbis]
MRVRIGKAILGWGAVALILFSGAKVQAKGFEVTVLGAHGGLEDGNLSAYLLREQGANVGVLLDAGTVLNGMEKADAAHAFDRLTLPDDPKTSRAGGLVHHVIQGYLISHAHLDHVAGLIAVSPNDPGKPIYALPSVLSVMQDDLFNHRVWPNLADRGPKPALGLFHYHDLLEGQSVPLAETTLTVTSYPLSHGGVESTAFLLRSGADALLYLGDTGPDAVEHSNRLETLWRLMAPLVRAHQLRGMIIECSYDNSRADAQLFGHMTPLWLLRELRALKTQAGLSMKGFPVLVSHIKPVLTQGEAVEHRIEAQLGAGNEEGFRFIIARQGAQIAFP